jgi:hypothetical protein
LDYPRFDVLVVDSAPGNSASRDVAARWGVSYVVEPRPGASRARNRGARQTDAEIVAYLDTTRFVNRVGSPRWWKSSRTLS